MNSYKVSLIIPCYNIESTKRNTFENTLNTIKNQTIGFDNIELILVDDCSTDNTHDYLIKLTNIYLNIKVFSTEHNTGGPSVPRNIGIEKATSNYIMFLDQDDTLNPNAMMTLYECIKENNLNIVKMNHNIVINGIIQENDMYLNEKVYIKPKSYELKYISLYIWDGIYDRNFIMGNNIRFKNIRTEDSLFMTECLCYNQKNICALNDLRGINYNSDNTNSISHNCFDLKNLDEHILSSKRTFNLLIENSFDKKYIEEVSSIHKFSAMIYLFYSNESKEVKTRMFNLLKQFLKQFSNIPFVKTTEFTSLHYYFWKTINFLILNDFKNLTFIVMNLMKKILKNNRQ